MQNKPETVKTELVNQLVALCEAHRELTVISLCTADGFSIKSFAAKNLGTQADKLAAMSSTICALSNSTAGEILDGQFEVTIIETNAGNMLFVRAKYLGKPCVLMVCARISMPLATVRYKTIKLAEAIGQLSQ